MWVSSESFIFVQLGNKIGVERGCICLLFILDVCKQIHICIFFAEASKYTLYKSCTVNINSRKEIPT